MASALCTVRAMSPPHIRATNTRATHTSYAHTCHTLPQESAPKPTHPHQDTRPDSQTLCDRMVRVHRGAELTLGVKTFRTALVRHSVVVVNLLLVRLGSRWYDTDKKYRGMDQSKNR
jgi:hypothetical protein